MTSASSNNPKGFRRGEVVRSSFTVTFSLFFFTWKVPQKLLRTTTNYYENGVFELVRLPENQNRRAGGHSAAGRKLTATTIFNHTIAYLVNTGRFWGVKC